MTNKTKELEDWIIKIEYIKREMIRLKKDNNNLIRNNIKLSDENKIFKDKLKEKKDEN